MPAKTEFLAQIAYLISRGFTQGEAGALIGLKSAETSRLVAHAYSVGLLKRPHFSEEVFSRLWPSKEERIDINQLRIGLTLKAGLMNKGARVLTQVKVLSSVSTGATPEIWNIRQRDFAKQALPHFCEMLSAARLCGIGWGSTIAALVSALEEDGPAPNPAIRLAATCGDLFDTLPYRDSSTSLVERLHSIGYGARKSVLTLRGLPALLPSHLRQFYLDEHPSFRALFNPKSGMAGKLDAIITSVGAVAQEGGTKFKIALLDKMGLDENRLKNAITGDISGTLVPRERISPDARKDVERISSTWTGISLAQYRQTAERAARIDSSRGSPGVIVYAIGSNKAEIVHEVVKAGLVNRLVIDLDLAQALAILAEVDLVAEVRTGYQCQQIFESVEQVVAAYERLNKSERSMLHERLRLNPAEGGGT